MGNKTMAAKFNSFWDYKIAACAAAFGYRKMPACGAMYFSLYAPSYYCSLVQVERGKVQRWLVLSTWKPRSDRVIAEV